MRRPLALRACTDALGKHDQIAVRMLLEKPALATKTIAPVAPFLAQGHIGWMVCQLDRFPHCRHVGDTDLDHGTTAKGRLHQPGFPNAITLVNHQLRAVRGAQASQFLCWAVKADLKAQKPCPERKAGGVVKDHHLGDEGDQGGGAVPVVSFGLCLTWGQGWGICEGKTRMNR